MKLFLKVFTNLNPCFAGSKLVRWESALASEGRRAHIDNRSSALNGFIALPYPNGRVAGDWTLD